MNMEHFSRIAFWIFILSSCLQAKPTPGPGIPISDWTLDYNAIVENGCPNKPNSTFYSPKTVKGCITTALKCFKLQLNTARAKCGESDDLPGGIEFLARLIRQRKHSGYGLNATCDACETSPQLSFKDFMEAMDRLVKLHYTINSS